MKQSAMMSVVVGSASFWQAGALTEGAGAHSKTNPIRRVIDLMEKMKRELKQEAEKETKMYDQMVCWCKTNEKEKTTAVENADAKEGELETEIQTRSARFGELATNIDYMKGQIAEESAGLKEARSIREKGTADFRQEEKDLVQAIANLRNAIAVMKKHQGSLLQLGPSLLSSLRVTLRDASLKYELVQASRKRRELTRPSTDRAVSFLEVRSASLSSSDRALLSALDPHGASLENLLPARFAQQVVERSAREAATSTPASEGAFLQMGHKRAGPTDQIFGIMEQMMEDFKTELSKIQSEEKQANADYESMAAAKEATISAGQKNLDAMESELFSNQKAVEDAKEDLDITRNQRSADVKFLQNLKLTCNDLDAQWEERTKTRAAENQAISAAIEVLTDDDNREMAMGATGFLQLRSAGKRSVARAEAAAALRKAADEAFDADDLMADWEHRGGAPASKPAQSPRLLLSTLAVRVQLDSFTKIKAMMDELVATLKKQQEEEVQFKQYCVKELNENEKATFDKNTQRKDVEAKLEELNTLMDSVLKEIADAEAQIAENQLEIKKASQNREGENAAFQALVSDQRATQGILKKALGKLKSFYFLQQSANAKVSFAQQAPPVQFNKQKKNAGGSVVMGLIEQIIEDSVKLEKEAIGEERKAQADYETLVNDANALIKLLSEANYKRSQANAATKEEAADTNGDLDFANNELSDLKQYNADLHGECDFVLKNFDVRQKARLSEMEAIQQAKSILSGAK